MKITINGEERTFLSPQTVSELLQQLGPSIQHGVAVCLNDTVLSRSVWESTSLQSGDTLEIIHATQGG